MRPGDKIGAVVNGRPKTGSVGCLLQADGKHYFTTARHVAYGATTVMSADFKAVNAVTGEVVTEATTVTLLDTCLVLITKGSGENSLALGNEHQIPINGVWDPRETLQRLDAAKTLVDQQEIEKETLAVSHLGGALLQKNPPGQIGSFNGVLQYGLIKSNTRRLRMTGRTAYAGDSGGPVFTQDGVLVGFISLGDEAGASEQTEVVLAYYIIEDLQAKIPGLRLS